MTDAIKNAKAVLARLRAGDEVDGDDVEAASTLIDHAESLERQRDAVRGEEGLQAGGWQRSGQCRKYAPKSGERVPETDEGFWCAEHSDRAAELEAALERERVLRAEKAELMEAMLRAIKGGAYEAGPCVVCGLSITDETEHRGDCHGADWHHSCAPDGFQNDDVPELHALSEAQKGEK